MEFAIAVSIAMRPGAVSAVPEVTMNGRSEPASTGPEKQILFAPEPSNLKALIVWHQYRYCLGRRAAGVRTVYCDGIDPPVAIPVPLGTELHVVCIHDDRIGFLVIRWLIA